MYSYCIMARKLAEELKKEVVADAVNPHASAVVAAAREVVLHAPLQKVSLPLLTPYQ